MTRSLLAVALALWATGADPSTPFMPVDQIRPGMVGTGHTVFAGADREPFKAHIIGVLEDVIGPGRDIILARLEGGPIKDAGVMQGMSGSPIYIDGRLIGAVSYALGAFPKEPIAGITPIAEMIDAAALTTPRPAADRVAIELPLTADRVAASLRTAHARLFGAPMSPAAALQGLHPIGVPLVMGGVDPLVADFMRTALDTTAFMPIATGTLASSSRTPTPDPVFTPGDAIGVALVTGDLQMGATGTVTYVDGDRVYGFGHPFLNLGPIDFPMTRADVLTVLPSVMTSMKVTALGEVVGAVTQDRATTIAGRIGAQAATVPISLRLNSDHGGAQDLHFNIVHDPMLTPLYGFVAVLNSLAAYERQSGASTFAVTGTIDVDGKPMITFDDVASGDGALTAGAAAVAGPLSALLATDLGEPRITGIAIDIAASEKTSTATIERAWIDAVQPRAGDTVPLHVQVRHYRGAVETLTFPIAIPDYAHGRLSLLISDAAALATWERQDGRTGAPSTLPALVRALNETPRANRVYVRLIADAPGAIVNGEPMSALPPSVQSVLTENRAGNTAPLRTTVLGEWERRLDASVSGSRELSFSVDPGR